LLDRGHVAETDHYQVLGIAPSATDEQIREAYR
jgi:curved DNA-binding protein CbpA